MGKPSKVRVTEVDGGVRLDLPLKLARRLPFPIDDHVEWIIVDDDTVVLRRNDEPFVAVKKNPSSVTRLF